MVQLKTRLHAFPSGEKKMFMYVYNMSFTIYSKIYNLEHIQEEF